MSEAETVAVTAPLDSFAVLEVHGKDAERFLQGQCTAQLAHADDRFAPLAAFCTPKGRMVTNARIVRPEATRYWLLMHPSSVDVLERHLRKYIVFYKATLAVRNDVAVQGLQASREGLTSLTAPLPPTLPGAWVALGSDGLLMKVEGERCLLWIGTSSFPHSAHVDALPQGTWQRLQVEAGIAWLQASQTDAWLPDRKSVV